MRLLHICLYIFNFHRRVWYDWAFHEGSRKHKAFSNHSHSSSNLETAPHLTLVKGYLAVMVGSEYRPFWLLGAASASVWDPVSTAAFIGRKMALRGIVAWTLFSLDACSS